jgi:hypothetical protein
MMRTNLVAGFAALTALFLIPAYASAQRVPRAADGKPDLSGVYQPGSDTPGTWAEANPSALADPTPGKPPQRAAAVRQIAGGSIPYQAWAQKRILEAWERRNADDTMARCIPELDLGGGSLYPLQIVQTPQLVVILVESRHVFRLIPINGKHDPDFDSSYLGDSVGHWEGDTLVVDVTNFKERLVGSKISTDALHVVERYTRVDQNIINYEAHVEDPKALTKPYDIKSKYALRPGTRLQEYVCENNETPQQVDDLDQKGLIKR